MHLSNEGHVDPTLANWRFSMQNFSIFPNRCNEERKKNFTKNAYISAQNTIINKLKCILS